MHDSGRVSYVTKALEDSGAVYEIFSDVMPDPDIGTISKGWERS
jgi:alcohol dehydrogenase class IV